ncbi:MAG: FG-GAP-like repeat-containing protein [Polaribacter sp.]|uniref:FG-GAP-like repeat-containing protein n=1 Tax=Polaribacter sp. TaxID=1920175 RepID=UPI003BB17F8F
MKIRISKAFLASFLFFFIFQTKLVSQQFFKRIENLVGFGNLMENNGISVADYDGDFDLDVFVVSLWKDEQGKENTQSKLFRNNGNGTYTDVTKGSGLENLLLFNELDASYNNFLGLKGFKFGAYWGDYDNDGDPDIFFTHLSKVQLFNNQGNGTFIDVTNAAGIVGKNNCENTGAIWFDYNNDRFLDIYIADWKGCNTNTLYKNNGDGTFENVTKTTNIETLVDFPGYNPFPFDFNKDGWMDLYVTNDFLKPNQLFINNNGVSFTEKAATYNVAINYNDMGITVGDYNKDGIFDFYITTISNNSLLTGKPDGTFDEKASEMQLKNTGWSWGTTFADFDLDGDEDLIVVNGFQNTAENVDINYYFENTFTNGIASFSNTNNQGLKALTESMEVVDFDYDFDGDLDVFITNSTNNSFFYENTTINITEEQNGNWFQLSLQGTLSNRDAIGTIVKLKTDKDTYIRYYSGVGFLGQSLKPVHFGLADSTIIEELQIEWPSGHIDIYTDLDLNTFGKAIENISYQKLTISPASKIVGCTDPNSCNYNPQATVNDGSCAYAATTGKIIGSKNASFFSTENYSYNLASGYSINWQVEGGEIISGQGTATITVKWEFETVNKVSLVVTNNLCKSEEISLDVTLSLENISDDKSIARIWNEALLEAIRGDFARPTIHARNLFHTSIAMYDAWAIYSDEASTYLLGYKVHNFTSTLSNFTPQENVEISRKKAISYAAYRLLSHRFKNSPSTSATLAKFNILMNQLGYDTNFTSLQYEDGNAAALGNYIAKTIIDYGNLDGAREQTGYDNAYYSPINSPMVPVISGNPNLSNPNRWQSLSLETYIDQSGNLISGEVIDFLSPEWGNVWPFSMNESHKKTYQREGNLYNVYHNPSNPPYLDSSNATSSEAYKKGFSQVAIWSSHLDPEDGVLWDISPKSIGNIASSSFPTEYNDYDNFYKLLEGGDIGKGHDLNPKTNASYESQVVPRGDYTRVLAEFWADGPDSETPPGHWFTILNYVNDHPQFVKKISGTGEILNPLEWDVKAYFILAGAMHDAAVASWSIKGWYDYIRPISAIRYMADLGQSSNSSLPNYHANGILLKPGYIELVTEDDPLALGNSQNIGKIKLFTWRGHTEINNPNTDQAGVGWILAENWWPYQRPSFVTPPFAGFVSGHSTYSRTAAEVMTLLTGDAFFPGGMGEFTAKKDEFLVFEQGPSVDIVLQWATYRDASDQCSLSRIWGGIHPPADDIPGRIIGKKIGVEAFDFAIPYFSNKNVLSVNTNESFNKSIVFPNPVIAGNEIFISNASLEELFFLSDINGRTFSIYQQFDATLQRTTLQFPGLSAGIYILTNNKGYKWKLIVQ